MVMNGIRNLKMIQKGPERLLNHYGTMHVPMCPAWLEIGRNDSGHSLT